MKRRTATIILGIIFSFCSAQEIDERYWKRYRSMADSVVSHHLGAEVRAKYVYTEEEIQHDLSDLVFVSGDSIMAWQDRHMIKTVPSYCYFEYEIGLDKREVGSTIRFALDPSGQFVQGEPSNGLPSTDKPREGFAMPLKAFERIAQDHGLYSGKKDRYRSLEWKPADEPGHLIASGTYELTLGRYIGEGYEVGNSCAYLFDIIEGIRFDAYTGEIIAKGTFRISTGITRHPSTL